MEIEKYLFNHVRVRIGIPLPGYVCCETIVDDPIEIVSVVRDNNCYISEIRWWDRVEIKSGSSIGYGGPRDPRSPKSHYFAETDICKTFDEHTLDEEYYDYLEQTKRFYSSLEIFPSFDIKYTRQKEISTS